MQHDSHSVRIYIAEVHDGDAFNTIEQVTDGSGVPTRHVGQQPARRWGQVTPCPQVLNEEHGADGPIEGQIVEQGSLRYRHLAKYCRDPAEVDYPIRRFVPTALPAVAT